MNYLNKYKWSNIHRWILFLALGSSLWLNAQNQPKVTAEVDTKTIKIGEQIKYQISVEAKDEDLVSFPEGQTFSPLEMISSDAIDTFRIQEKQRLVKNYYLTLFDSGTYIIPRQRIGIGNQFFTTDSLAIQVQNVAVDTLKQPMFDIKPITMVSEPKSHSYWLWIAGFVLLLLGAIGVYLFFFRKKRLTEQEKIALLPPFDRAIMGLKNLQNSKYLLESKHKEYYSELTDIVRRYLEEEIHISATESTTDELIAKMEALLDSERLHLSRETISDFKRVLQKADLVKFAKSEPQDHEAESDRQTIETMVVKTKEALPEPTQEEKMNSEFYREQMLKDIQKKKRRNAIIMSAYALFFLCSIIAGWFVYKYYFGDTPAEKYLKKEEWVTSLYGYPPIKVTTPEVLERRKSQEVKFMQGFTMGDALDNNSFSMTIFSTHITTKNQGNQLSEEDIKTLINENQNTIDNYLKGKNILLKNEPYTSTQGIEGLKIFGSFDRETSDGKHVKMGYQSYYFLSNGNISILNFVYPRSDEEKSSLLIEKIMYSVEFAQD